MSEDSCKTCRCWKAGARDEHGVWVVDGTKIASDMGTCRQAPPHKSSEDDDAVYYEQPISHSDDWCARHWKFDPPAP